MVKCMHLRLARNCQVLPPVAVLRWSRGGYSPPNIRVAPQIFRCLNSLHGMMGPWMQFLREISPPKHLGLEPPLARALSSKQQYENTVSDDTWQTAGFLRETIDSRDYSNRFTLLTKEESTDIINYLCTKGRLQFIILITLIYCIYYNFMLYVSD